MTFKNVHEVSILRHHARARASRGEEDVLVLHRAHLQVAHADCFDAELFGEPKPRLLVTGERRARPSSGEHRVVEALAGISKAGKDVLDLEIGELSKDLCIREASGEQIQDVRDSNAQPTDARSSTALARIDGDPFLGACHAESMPETPRAFYSEHTRPSSVPLDRATSSRT